MVEDISCLSTQLALQTILPTKLCVKQTFSDDKSNNDYPNDAYQNTNGSSNYTSCYVITNTANILFWFCVTWKYCFYDHWVITGLYVKIKPFVTKSYS